MKKVVIFLLVLLTCGYSVFSQGYWTQKASLPTFGRQLGVAVAASNGLIYIGTGDAGAYGENITDFWVYNPSNNTWAQKASFTGAGRRMASCYALGNKIYLGLGADFDGDYTLFVDFYEYNIASNTWSQKANFPGTARRDATSFVMNGKGYICFGYNGSSFLSDIWEYNYNSDTWTQKANFPGPARAAAVSFVIGKKAYVGTGAGNSAYLTDFWCYDQDLDTWTQKASLPGVGRRFASGFALQNYGYIGTGWDGSNDLKDFWEYNATLNSWSQIPDLTGDARSACSGFALGNRGFAGLGIDDGPDIYYSDLWEYTPSWSAINEAEINDDDFTVFPNLVADWITIENNNCSGKFNCKIIDINGRAITERTIDFSQEQLPKMNLLFIKSGRYFIVFEGNNGRIVKSFIKI